LLLREMFADKSEVKLVERARAGLCPLEWILFR